MSLHGVWVIAVPALFSIFSHIGSTHAHKLLTTVTEVLSVDKKGVYHIVIAYRVSREAARLCVTDMTSVQVAVVRWSR